MARSVYRWWFLAGAAVMILITGVLILNKTSEAVTPGSEPTGEKAEMLEDKKAAYAQESSQTISEDLDVFDVQDAVDQNGNRYIIGKVRSKSGKPYTYLEINFTLHDASREVLEAVTINKTGLKADEVWEFQKAIDNPTAQSYRLSRTYGW